MTTSILSFPTRGNYGRSNWRGNCSGYVIKEMLEFYRPKVFVDPAEGGLTSRDVCRELNAQGAGIEYVGLDLHSGFNLLRDSLTDRIGGSRAEYAFFHPPYWKMVLYSGRSGQWGNEPHPDDLSHAPTYEDFILKMRLAMQNIYDAVAPGGHFSILVGDYRKDGKYISIQADLQMLAPGALDGILIKTQHNCVSDKTRYSGKNFIPIMHEYLLNFRKDRRVVGFLDSTLSVSRRLEMFSKANWRATIYHVLRKLGGKARLPEIYQAIAETSPDKIKTRPNWAARVRRELQIFCVSVERGVWALQPDAAPRARAAFAAA